MIQIKLHKNEEFPCPALFLRQVMDNPVALRASSDCARPSFQSATWLNANMPTMLMHTRALPRLLLALAASSMPLPGMDASAATCAVLAYHRFGPHVADSMTVRTAHFEQQISLLRERGYQTITLAALVDGVSGKAVLPDKALAITVDDGHGSVYTELLPVINRLAIPVTLFIYPSAISHADYAMTWEQLAALARNPLIQVQSHTYWHPNFRVERRRLTEAGYTALVRMQLERARAVLQGRLGLPVSYLAWPYGIEDAMLRDAARAAGYTAAFSLGNRMISAADSRLALPRFLVTDGYTAASLLHALDQAAVPCPTGLL